jgi:hypothetical protein
MNPNTCKFFATFFIAVFLSLNCFAILTFEKKIEAGNYSVCQRILCLSDSGYLVTGFSESTVQSSIACRLNSAGDTLWLKKFGTNDFSLEAVEMNGSGYLIVGATQNNAGDQSSGVWKVDVNGNLQWAKIITPDTSGYSIFTSIKKIGNNYLIGGFADFGNIVGSGGEANTLVMIDSSGTVLWSNMYWVDSEYYSILSMILTSDNNILVTGNAEANYAMKFDMSGNLLWAKIYSEGVFSSLEEINNSYYFFGFNTSSECFITRTNSNGDVDWAKSYINLEEPYQICQNYSGGLSLVTSMYAMTNYQASVLEIDTFGMPTKLTSFPSASDDLGTDLNQTLDGGYILSVEKVGSISDAIGIIKADSAMHTGCEINNILPLTSNLSIQGVDFYPQVINTFHSLTIQLAEESGGIITSICNGSGTIETNNSIWNLYPTISSGKFHISSNVIGVLCIFNSLGVKIKELKFDREVDIDLSGNSPGIYFYKVFLDHKEYSESGKFIIQ